MKRIIWGLKREKFETTLVTTNQRKFSPTAGQKGDTAQTYKRGPTEGDFPPSSLIVPAPRDPLSHKISLAAMWNENILEKGGMRGWNGVRRNTPPLPPPPNPSTHHLLGACRPSPASLHPPPPSFPPPQKGPPPLRLSASKILFQRPIFGGLSSGPLSPPEANGPPVGRRGLYR